jgi:hypothetical protein
MENGIVSITIRKNVEAEFELSPWQKLKEFGGTG